MKNKKISLQIRLTKGVKFFVLFLFGIIPSITILSIFFDLYFIVSRPASRLFNITLVVKSFLKLLFVFYGVTIAYCINNNRSSFKMVKIYLLAILFSPLVIELPFFVLSYLLNLTYFPINDVISNSSMTIPFSLFWLVYFSYIEKKYMNND